MSVEYKDPRISCDAEGITIRKYAFPFGDKRVSYDEVKSWVIYPMTAMKGKWRIWGGDPTHWFHLDTSRPKKEKAIILDLGKMTKPVLTPDDVDAMVEVLRQHCGEPAEA